MAKSDNIPSNELSAEQIAAAKALLMSAAETQYKKITKSVSVMQQFSAEIAALRRTGYPWATISAKIKDATKVSISATTLRNYFARPNAEGGKKSRPESVSAEPNVFAPETHTTADGGAHDDQAQLPLHTAWAEPPAS